MGTRRAFVMTTAFLALLAVPGVGPAAEPSDAALDPAARRVTRTIGGIEVQIDSVTGRLVQPNAAQARELATYLIRALDRSPDRLEVVRHPDGMASVDLRGRFQSVTVVTLGADSRPALRCVTDARAGEALLEAATHGVDPAATDAPAPRAVEK